MKVTINIDTELGTAQTDLKGATNLNECAQAALSIINATRHTIASVADATANNRVRKGGDKDKNERLARETTYSSLLMMEMYIEGLVSEAEQDIAPENKPSIRQIASVMYDVLRPREKMVIKAERDMNNAPDK